MNVTNPTRLADFQFQAVSRKRSPIEVMDMDIKRKEDVANDRSCWRCDLHRGLEQGEKERSFAAGVKSVRNK